MPSITLTNPTKSLSKLSGIFTKYSLKKLNEGLLKPPGSLVSSSDINQNPYYLLVNPDNSDEAYFCFPKTVVAGWSGLEQAAEQNFPLSTVTLEYQESEKNMRIYRQVLRIEIS